MYFKAFLLFVIITNKKFLILCTLENLVKETIHLSNELPFARILTDGRLAHKYIMQKCDKILNDLCDPHKGRLNLHNHRSHKSHWYKMRNITTL